METLRPRVHALGVAGGPAPDRLTTSYLVGEDVVIDTGAVAWRLPAERRARLRTLLLTHAHLDHTLGLPFLLAEARLAIHGHPETLRAVRASLLDGCVWPDLSGRASWHPCEPGDRVEAGGVVFEAGPAHHTVPCLSWLLRAADGAGPAIALVGDTGPAEAVRAWAASRAPRHCIVEASLPDAQADEAHRWGHQTPRDLRDWRRALGPEPHLHVTHLKPETERTVRAECEALADPHLTLLAPDDVLEL